MDQPFRFVISQSIAKEQRESAEKWSRISLDLISATCTVLGFESAPWDAYQKNVQIMTKALNDEKTKAAKYEDGRVDAVVEFMAAPNLKYVHTGLASLVVAFVNPA